MAKEVTNLLMGSGEIYYADYGTSLPADLNTSSDGTLTWTSWTQLGFKDGGCDLEVDSKFYEDRVDDTTGIVQRVIIEQDARLIVNLAEIDLDHLALAIPASTKSVVAKGASQVAQDVLKFGGGSLTAKSVCFVGKSPEGYYRLVHMLKCDQVEKVKITAKKEKRDGVPLAFACLDDMTESAGERQVHIYDMTDVPTS